MVSIIELVNVVSVIALLMRNLCQDLIVLHGFSCAVNWNVTILGPTLIPEQASLHFALIIQAIFITIAWEDC